MFYRSLFKQRTSTEKRIGTRWNLREALVKISPKQHSAIVLDMVRQTIAKTLSSPSPDDADVIMPRQDIGIDSLTAVLIRNELAKLESLTLLVRIVF